MKTVIEVTQREREILTMVLKSYLSDLRMEIAGTDSKDFRDGLKERKAVLNKVLRQLRGQEQHISL